MKSNIFDDLPDDFDDALIKNFDEKCARRDFSMKKRQIWRVALTWALEQNLSELLLQNYADVVFKDCMIKIEFKQELYDKFSKTRD